MAFILGITLATTSLLLPLNVYPGLLSEVAFLAAIGAPFWLPAACLTWWFFVDMRQQVADVFGTPAPRRRRLVPAALLVALNCGFLWWGAPRRLAFSHARSAFETSAATAPPAYAGSGRFDRQLGVYHVDRLATDPRGGVYFRTRSGPDGFGANTISYGFSCRPNRVGSPFGDQKYALAHVVGDWYAFQASGP
jgi:hypothetical protein